MINAHSSTSFRSFAFRVCCFVFAFLLPQVTAIRALSGQTGDIVVDPGHVDGERPAACPPTTFWWSVSIGNIEVDGYYFDANPFNLTKWTSQTSGIYSSTRGRSVVDQSSTKLWTDARVMASCWESSLGPIHVWWARLEQTLGTVVSINTACNDSPDQLASAVYDPTSPGGTHCGDGETGNGSGTQFHPGNHTGGETVGWSDGIGNGGSSVCGLDAVVEYICIDVWNEQTGHWDTWDCGYATTC